MTRQARVYRIAAPLITKNAVLCRTQARPLLGFTAKNVHSYPSELSASARKSLALDERLQVMQVLEGVAAGDADQAIAATIEWVRQARARREAARRAAEQSSGDPGQLEEESPPTTPVGGILDRLRQRRRRIP